MITATGCSGPNDPASASIIHTREGARERGRRRGREGGRGEMEISHSALPCDSGRALAVLAAPHDQRPCRQHPYLLLGGQTCPASAQPLCSSPSQPDLTGGSIHIFNLLLTPGAEAFTDLGMNTFQTPHQSKCTLSKSTAFNSWVFS